MKFRQISTDPSSLSAPAAPSTCPGDGGSIVSSYTKAAQTCPDYLPTCWWLLALLSIVIFFPYAEFIASVLRKCLYNIFQHCHLVFSWYLFIFLYYILNISAGFCQYSHCKFRREVLVWVKWVHSNVMHNEDISHLWGLHYIT
jgi:hypothetical protein